MCSREGCGIGCDGGRVRSVAAMVTAAVFGLLVCLAMTAPMARCADRQSPAAKGSREVPAAPGARKSGKPAAVGAVAPSSTGESQAPKPKAPSRPRTPEKWDPERAAGEYRSLELELALAKTGQIYLVFDTERRQLQLRLKGAVVWNCPVEIAPENSGDLDRFAARFRGSDRQGVRLVSGRYLFSGAERTPDSILAIVGQVVRTDPSTLQRDVPERFQIFWGWGLVLDVRTSVVGLPKSRFRNTDLSVIQAIRRPFGQVLLEVRVSPEAALTLYRTASPGLPTLLDPYP
jgi:hypothetical protein